MDEAVVGRVRDLRDQVKSTVSRLRSAKDRIEAARDAIAAEEQALAGARQAVAGAPVDAGRDPRRTRGRARKDQLGRGRPRRRRRRDPGRTRRDARRLRLGAPARRPDPARQRQRPDLAGRAAPWSPASACAGAQMHEGIDIAVPEGTPIRAAASGTRDPPAGRSRKRRLRQLHLHRPRRRAVHLLRPPVGLRGQLRTERLPGRRDRLHRLHRPLLRPSRPLRGAGQRRRRPIRSATSSAGPRRDGRVRTLGSPNIGYAGWDSAWHPG